MATMYKGINRKFIEGILGEMNNAGEDFLDIPFDVFKGRIHCETEAHSIRSICHHITNRMNEVGPSNWFLKVGSRNYGCEVHISRMKKEVYSFPSGKEVPVYDGEYK